MRKTALVLGLTAALSLTALPALSAPKIVEKTITTAQGRSAKLGENRSWNDDCSPRRTVVTILKQPENGELTIIDITSKIPAEPGVGTVQPECVGKPVPGNQVVYTPKLGYRGDDYFEYALAFDGTPAVTCRIKVVVK